MRTLALLVLATLVPARAAAQSADAFFDASSSRGSAPRVEGEAPRDPPDFGTTFGHALAGYGIGLAVGAAAGTVVGGVLVIPAETITPIFAGLSIGAVTHAPFGAALGAWGWGDTGGGTGNFFASFGLAYAGQALGAAWFLAFTYGVNEFGVAVVGGALLGAFASVLGAAVGYDLTMDGPDESASSESTSLVVPYAAPTENVDGATAGVMGVF